MEKGKKIHQNNTELMYVDYDFFNLFYCKLFLIVFFWSLLSANFIGCSFGGLINEQGL